MTHITHSVDFCRLVSEILRRESSRDDGSRIRASIPPVSHSPESQKGGDAERERKKKKTTSEFYFHTLVLVNAYVRT